MNDETRIIYEPAPTKHWRTLHPKKCMVLGIQNLNPGEELVLFIPKFEVDQIILGKNGREDRVTFIWFERCNVPMCLNKTNTDILISLYGKTWDKWIGKPVQIYGTEVEVKGTSVDCLRFATGTDLCTTVS